MGILDQLQSRLITEKFAQQRARQKKRNTLLEDPKKLDEYVGRVFEQVSPSKVIAKKKTAESLTDRVSAAIPEKHPLKTFGQELKTNLASELARPENARYSVREITTGISKYLLNQKVGKAPKDGQGDYRQTRLESAYELQRLNETSRNPWTLGLTSGEDKRKKAPLAFPGMETYGQYKTRRFEAERKLTGAEFSFNDYIHNINKSMVEGFGWGAGAAIVAGQLGPQVATPEEVVTAPVAGATTALAFGAAEAVAYPLRSIIEKTEWGSTRKYSSRLRDRLKVTGVELIPDAFVLTAAESKLLKAVTVENESLKLALAKPTASRVIKASTVGNEVAKEFKKTAKPNKAVKMVRDIVLRDSLAADEKTILSYGNRFSKLSKQAKKEAITYEEGILKGIEYAEERQITRDILEGTRTAESTVVSEGGKAAKGSKELEDASKDLGEAWVSRNVPVRTGGGNEALAKQLREDIRAAEPEREITGIDRALFPEKYGRRVSDKKAGVPDRRTQTIKVAEEHRAGVERRHPVATQYQDYVSDLEAEMFGVRSKGITASETAKPTLRLQERVSQGEALTTVSEVDATDSLLETFGVTQKATKTVAEDIKAAEKVAKEVFPPITEKEAQKTGAGIIRGVKEGTISIPEAEAQVNELTSRLGVSHQIGRDKQLSMIRSANGFLKQIQKSGRTIAGLAAFGLGPGIFLLFSPEEAEAGVVTSAARASEKILAKEAEVAIREALAKQSHVVEKITSKEVVHLPEKQFMRGLTDSAAGGPSKVLRNVSGMVKTGRLPKLGLLSVGAQLNAILKLGEGIMNNPAIFKVSYMMSEFMNISNGMRVFSNILEKAGVKSSAKEVAELFKPLIPQVESQIGFDYATKRIGDLTRELKILKTRKIQTQAIKDNIKGVKQQLAIARKDLAKHGPEVGKFHNNWASTANYAARKYKSVRMFLAADDNVQTFAKYPFMKDIWAGMPEVERFAVGRIKRQMAVYKKRLEKEGIATRSGAYMHYTLHPDVDAKMAERIIGNKLGTPYLKNYSRSANSRPMIPDVFSSVGNYVPDVERRLQTQGFWNSGWRKVRNRTRFIEPLAKAFDALEKGTRPIERSWGNTAARWYTTFEVFKRLALSPSAGLKHLVKMTGDMATAGVGETVQALPSSLKGVSWRIMDFTPGIRARLNKLGYGATSVQDKLQKSMFDSVVPAMDTRWRMSQMGFSDYNSYFNKFEVMADKISHVGSSFITLAENIDRGISLEAGLRIAAKKGMTPEQALYGIYDLVLKNNFLGREFTPEWLRNPKVKSLFMFQTTPFKIMERKVVNAIRTGRSIKELGRNVEKATRTAEGRKKLLDDLTGMWKYMKDAESEMKSNIWVDSLRSETDFFGNAAAKQFAKDILIMGAATAAGSAAGVNLWHHFFHIPFINSYYGDYTNISVSPGVRAILDGYSDYKHRDYLDDEMLTTKVVKRWMGKSGPLPDIGNKLMRLSRDDIPEMYRDSKFKYLFSIPATEEEQY